MDGAALDTFAREPLSPRSPLRELADAVLDELAGRRPAHVYNPGVYDVRREKGLHLLAGRPGDYTITMLV